IFGQHVPRRSLREGRRAGPRFTSARRGSSVVRPFQSGFLDGGGGLLCLGIGERTATLSGGVVKPWPGAVGRHSRRTQSHSPSATINGTPSVHRMWHPHPFLTA